MSHDHCHRTGFLCTNSCPDCSRVTEAEYEKIKAESKQRWADFYERKRLERLERQQRFERESKK